MGKPKVENPQKVSLKLPKPVAQRLKIEAVKRGTIEAFIVRDALELYWQVMEKEALIDGLRGVDLETTPLHMIDFGAEMPLALKLCILDEAHRADLKAE